MAAIHGGAFWRSIQGDPRRLGEIVQADVLDAWFDPAPGVMLAIRENLPALCRTSPDARNGGLIRELATRRGISEASIVVGAGSSSLIFAGLSSLLTSQSEVLLVEPTYGEYRHVLENVVGCNVISVPTRRQDGYFPSIDQLLEKAQNVDMLLLVNPNSPTGSCQTRSDLEALLAGLPKGCHLWVDETYIEYAPAATSIESLVANRSGITVCKSMSKGYALSGLRVGYVVTEPETAERLRRITPPWAIGLLAETAAVEALRDPGYYRSRYAETAQMRSALANRLSQIEGLAVTEGTINCLLLHLGPGLSAHALVEECAEGGVYVRDSSNMWAGFRDNAVRVAIRSGHENVRTLEAVSGAVRRLAPNRAHCSAGLDV